jgi:uncharacterized membrane protein
MADPLKDIGAMLAGRIELKLRRKVGGVLLYCLGAFFLVVAAVAGIVSIGIALADRWGALSACLIIAGFALLMAVVMVLTAGLLAKVERRRQLAEAAQWRQAMVAAKTIFPELTAGKALLCAIALGFLVGTVGVAAHPADKAGP